MEQVAEMWDPSARSRQRNDARLRTVFGRREGLIAVTNDRGALGGG